MDHNGNVPREADRSIPELLKELANETTLLVRQELRLAQAEIVLKVQKAKQPAILFSAAGVCAFGAFGALTATLIIALALVMPTWAAALIVTAVYAAAGAVCAQRGTMALKKVGSPVPTQTIATVQSDIATVRDGVRSGR